MNAVEKIIHKFKLFIEASKLKINLTYFCNLLVRTEVSKYFLDFFPFFLKLFFLVGGEGDIMTRLWSTVGFQSHSGHL